MKGKVRIGFGMGIIWVLALVVAVTFVIRQSQVIAVSRQLAQLKEEIQYYTRANADIEAKINALKSPEYIEKVAREKLGLVKPGEVQYMTLSPEENR